MLRNIELSGCDGSPVFLNEVLSLNAQECQNRSRSSQQGSFLNEVLSLNAQESPTRHPEGRPASFLNEVLSLNAQEFRQVRVAPAIELSSMKS